MAKHYRRLYIVLAAGVALGAVTIGGTAYIRSQSATQPETTDNVRFLDDPRPPEQWAINAAYGRGALSNLQAALDEIANNNAPDARKGVAVAQSLLARIKPGFPPAAEGPSGQPVTADAADDSGITDALILVHSEVRVLGDADQNESVQAKLDNIRHEISMNDHDAIVAALDSLNIPLAYTRVDLPLTETISLANEALRALDSQDAVRARSKLMEIGDGLRIETVQLGTDAPQIGTDFEDDAG